MQRHMCLARTGALNFKDVMLAYGKLNRDMMSNGYVGCKLGFEFSGLLKGQRVMGVAKQAIATHVFARDFLVRGTRHSQTIQAPAQSALPCRNVLALLICEVRWQRSWLHISVRARQLHPSLPDSESGKKCSAVRNSHSVTRVA